MEKKNLKDAGREVWETLCIMEMEKRKNSPEYISASKQKGFKQIENKPTENTHLIIFKNQYYDEVLLKINILDMERSPYWIVKYLTSWGFDVNINH